MPSELVSSFVSSLISFRTAIDYKYNFEHNTNYNKIRYISYGIYINGITSQNSFYLLMDTNLKEIILSDKDRKGDWNEVCIPKDTFSTPLKDSNLRTFG